MGISQEDIESLGWELDLENEKSRQNYIKFIPIHYPIYKIFKKGQYELYAVVKELNKEPYKDGFGRISIYDYFNTSYTFKNQLFRGKIQNKSELIKLLIQLEI